MPQLMPLNWLYSSHMIMILCFLSGFIYGGVKEKDLKYVVNNKSKSSNLWYW